jgi:hypothetical protein
MYAAVARDAYKPVEKVVAKRTSMLAPFSYKGLAGSKPAGFFAGGLIQNPDRLTDSHEKVRFGFVSN